MTSSSNFDSLNMSPTGGSKVAIRNSQLAIGMNEREELKLEVETTNAICGPQRKSTTTSREALTVEHVLILIDFCVLHDLDSKAELNRHTNS